MTYIDKRPLSPHLTIHKKMQTAVLSIMHRITGVGLSLGLIVLVFFLFSIAMGENFYNIIFYLFSLFIFKTFLFCWSFSIFFHLINGLRYLVWSLGYGMNLKSIYSSGYLVIFISFSINIIIWLKILKIV